MTIHTQLCSFKTADSERLHGLLFTPQKTESDLALLFVHGVAMNFYLPPLVSFGQELAERGYDCFVINTRGHDWIARGGNLNAFAQELCDAAVRMERSSSFRAQIISITTNKRRS